MNDIDKIKQLLFGNEKKALDAITRRLETPASRTADIADVLPESILRSHADKRLAAALQEPVEQVVRRSVQRNPGEFADALFPVMGPAIRKAIAESLRAMMQSLNQAIENSLSVRTRYRAWRAGVPLGTYVLQQSIVYRVEQAYLIRRHDGLLVEHAEHDSVVTRDSDAVSAMFTAIQDFIRDSFSADRSESLTTAVMGELTLWALEGPHALLVCVIRGVPPASLRTELSEILEDIHLRHDEALLEFDGRRAVPGLGHELERCLALQRQKESARRAGGAPVAATLLLVVLALLAGWWLYARYDDARRLDRLAAALDAAPGVVVTAAERDAGRLVVHGLRDPLSVAPADVAAGLQIDPAELDFRLAPYQSLDPVIVERRARRLLDPPAGVGLQLEGSRLKLTGSAPLAWQRQAQSLAFAIPGVDSVDVSRLAVADADVLAAARQALQPPAGVELAFADGVLSARGSAPQRWLQQAAPAAAAVPGVRRADLQGVTVAERARLAALLAAADATAVYFSAGDTLASGQTAVLDRLAARLAEISELAATLGQTVRVRIRGVADGTGTAAANRDVELARAERVARHLIGAGMPAAVVDVRAAGRVTDRVAPDPALRRADVGIVVE